MNSIKEKEFKKSNTLINSKCNLSLIANKILAEALSVVKIINSRPVSVIPADMLRKAFKNYSKTSGSFYDAVKRVTDELLSKKVFIENFETSSFVNMNLIGKATYFDGELSLFFEPDAYEYLVDLNKHYTLFNLSTLLSLNSVYSFRLYEILKSRAYLQNAEKNKETETSCGLPELRVDLGLVDCDDISGELKKKKVNYEHILNNVAKKIKYPEFRDLKRYVIDPAIKEINEKTDIEVSYKPSKNGHGGKVTDIVFIFSKK